MVEVLEYLDQAGRSPFGNWIAGLDSKDAAKVSAAIIRLSLENWSNVKGVGEGVYERILDFGPGYRIYFGKDGDKLVILLAGGTKRAQQRDIVTAKGRWHDYKKRKKLREE